MSSEGVLGEFLFMQQSVTERDPCSVMSMNSFWALRVEAEDHHKRQLVYLRLAIDEPDHGCGIAWSLQVFAQGPEHSKRGCDQGIHAEWFQWVAQWKGVI